MTPARRAANTSNAQKGETMRQATTVTMALLMLAALNSPTRAAEDLSTPPWDFAQSEKPLGWTAYQLVEGKLAGFGSQLNVTDDGLKLPYRGQSLLLVLEATRFDAAAAKTLEVELKADKAAPARATVFWQDEPEKKWNGQLRVSVPVRIDVDFGTVRIPMKHPQWQGTIGRLRVDLALPAGEVVVRRIAVSDHTAPPPAAESPVNAPSQYTAAKLDAARAWSFGGEAKLSGWEMREWIVERNGSRELQPRGLDTPGATLDVSGKSLMMMKTNVLFDADQAPQLTLELDSSVAGKVPLVVYWTAEPTGKFNPRLQLRETVELKLGRQKLTMPLDAAAGWQGPIRSLRVDLVAGAGVFTIHRVAVGRAED